MNQKQDVKAAVEKNVRDIKRHGRRLHGAEDKIRIVLQGLRGEDSIAELCRKEGIHQNLYYRWTGSDGSGHQWVVTVWLD